MALRMGKFVAVAGVLALMSAPIAGFALEPSPREGKDSITTDDLEFCLDASSFFRDKGKTEVRSGGLTDSLEEKQRSTMSELADLYREYPKEVGFAQTDGIPVVPVAAKELQTISSSIQKVNGEENTPIEMKAQDKSEFVSVSQLCQSFIKVHKIANKVDKYMFYIINPETQRLDVEVENGVPNEVVRELETDRLVSIAYTEPLTLLGGRLDDTSPYRGGGLPQKGTSGYRCSLGYKIQNIDSGKNFMTMAAHCNNLGDKWYYGKKYIGYAITQYMVQPPTKLDIALLTGANYSPTIFRGSGGSTARVIGSLPGGGTVGASIGVSAGKSNKEFTGTYKGNQFTPTGCANLGATYCNLRAVVLANNATLQTSDSGSPVFAYTSNPGQVYALGTFTGYYYNYNKILYTDIEALLHATHSRVATS